MKTLRMALVAVAIVAGPLGAQDSVTGSWDGRLDGRVYLNLNIRSEGRGFSNWGRNYERSELVDLRTADGQVSFRIVRPAGVLAFRGTADRDESGGTFTFTVSPAYRQQMQTLGFRDLDANKLFTFALADLSIDDVKFLERTAQDALTTSQLVRMVNHGVSPEFVRGLSAAGFTNLTSSDMITTRDHGVTPEYIHALRKDGHNASLKGFVRARDHGVSADYVSEMRAAGFKLTLEQLITARDHGVSAEFVEEMGQLGYKGLSIDEYVRMRDHGVSPDFAFDLKEQGYASLSTSDLIRLRDHGVSGSFVRRVNRERSGRLNVAELIKLKSHGH